MRIIYTLNQNIVSKSIRLYNGQWVFMVNCKEGEYGSIIGGEIVLHNENRDVVFRSMGKFDAEPSLMYFRYAGKIPEGTSVLL